MRPARTTRIWPALTSDRTVEREGPSNRATSRSSTARGSRVRFDIIAHHLSPPTLREPALAGLGRGAIFFVLGRKLCSRDRTASVVRRMPVQSPELSPRIPVELIRRARCHRCQRKCVCLWSVKISDFWAANQQSHTLFSGRKYRLRSIGEIDVRVENLATSAATTEPGEALLTPHSVIT